MDIKKIIINHINEIKKINNDSFDYIINIIQKENEYNLLERLSNINNDEHVIKDKNKLEKITKEIEKDLILYIMMEKIEKFDLDEESVQ